MSKVGKDKYITNRSSSELISEIADRMEEIGYSLAYPDIKFYYDWPNYTPKEILFRFIKMDV